MLKKIVLSGFIVLLLGGCNPEMGRLPFESDVDCLRKELSSDDRPTFQMAANFCQETSHDILVPLKLKGAVDLQKQAEQANIAYTN